MSMIVKRNKTKYENDVCFFFAMRPYMERRMAIYHDKNSKTETYHMNNKFCK